MSLIEVQWQPTNRQLRQFGVICLAALPIVGWFWGAGTTTLGILAGVGAVVAIASFILPAVVKPIFVGLTLITLPIGLVIGELVLLLIYFGMFFPIALVFRLIGRDSLLLRRNSKGKSYWHEKAAPKGVASYFHQS